MKINEVGDLEQKLQDATPMKSSKDLQDSYDTGPDEAVKSSMVNNSHSPALGDTIIK